MPEISSLPLVPCFRFHLCEKQLIHSVESVVIEWCHLVRDVLNKSSAEKLLAGMNPGPLVEIDFWNARCCDLESVVDQVRVYVYKYFHIVYSLWQ